MVIEILQIIKHLENLYIYLSDYLTEDKEKYIINEIKELSKKLDDLEIRVKNQIEENK